MWWSSARLVFAVVLATALAGCGFQLRGKADLPFETLYIESANPVLVADLQRAVASGSRARAVTRPGDAQAVLRITGESREKRILSLSGAGRVREYLLVYRLAFRVTDRQNRPMLAEQQIELRRDMTYDDALVLAKASEEEMLYRDMQSDVIFQILRRLDAARPAPPPEAED